MRVDLVTCHSVTCHRFSRSFNLTRRVVVTGLGLITPVGNTVEDNVDRADERAQRRRTTSRSLTPRSFQSSLPAEVKDFDPLKFIAKKEARKMGAFIHYAIAAATEAMADSGFELTEEGKFPDDIAENAGTYISSGIGDFWAIEREHSKLLDEGPDRVSPFFIVSAIVNLAAGQVSIRLRRKGSKLGDRHRLFRRRARDRRQLQDHSARRCRRDDLRRRGVGDHADERRRLCFDARAFDAQRRSAARFAAV